MVGLVDPNASKVPEPVKSQENWLKGKLENPIQIKRPAQGMSPLYFILQMCG